MTVRELILDDFEHNDIHKYKLNHNFVETYEIAISDKHAKYGRKSLLLHYHFGGWRTGNGAMHIIFKENLSTHKRPVKIGLWVYGDGKSPWLRASFLDGLGDRKTVNLTEGNIDWMGWKYIDAKIDPAWELPLKLEMIYAAEVDKEHQGDSNYRGEIYFDQLRFVYVDDVDLKGPVFRAIQPEEDAIYRDTFMFSAKVSDEMSGVNPDSIQVQMNGEQTPHCFCAETQTITCHFTHLKEGTFHLSVQAEDYAGNSSNPGIEKTLTVDLSPDIKAPLISNITPTETAIEYTDTPRITFHLIDHKSGVAQEDIKIKLNDRTLDVVYDERTGWGYALADQKLTSGVHTFSIAAADRAGNKLKPVQRHFQTVVFDQPDNPDEFKLTIIPDTHSTLYSQLAFKNANIDSSDVVLHMGDMVDGGTVDELNELIKSRDHFLQKKTLLTIPGNHESFSGHLDAYMASLGSPTYHLEYGNMLLIALNSSYDQSIVASDASQFDYLKQLLENNTKDHVLIATHVPTRDDFGTAHGMDKDDAEKLERILGNYKQKSSHVNITVLFGHLHLVHQWEKKGVHYIITGNSASKSYVRDAQKNLLGYGMLTVSETGMKYHYKPYLDAVQIVGRDHQETVKMEPGTRLKLSVLGKLHALSPHDTVDLTEIDAVQKKWSTSNQAVVKVHQHGVIEACDAGEAIVSVNVYGFESMIKVIVG